MPSVILATAGYDHNIRFWEAPSGICYRTLPYPDSQVNKLEITPDKQYIAAAGNPHIRFFEVHTNNQNSVTSFDGHTSNVTSIGFQRDGKWMYSCSEDGFIKVWDLRATGCQREYQVGAPVNTLTLHPNQAELISGDQNGNIKVWDLTANKMSREVTPDGEVALRSVSIASDGSAAVASNNKGNCFVYRLAPSDTSRFDPVQKIEAHSTYALKCQFSPDSKLLATTSADHTVKLWSTNKEGGSYLKAHKTLTGHSRWVWDCVFSADSAYIVTASSDQVAKLWDINQGDAIRHYTGHFKAVSCVALKDC
eukprot:TRINITY_DN3411_c0_g1_i1.p1 TRINITY_DN3411_c0_g1~~TRINITY_DN3411_c0_g1_i1.p1  ORF type:complete len:316 (+),score=108.09 TRINITY_DN3411_c0_g1_i1:27-950(+)